MAGLDEATLNAIRLRVGALERERAAIEAAPRWRVPLFVGAVVVAVIVLAVAFNAFADPVEQWASAPHVFLYIAGFVAAALAFVAAKKPARLFEAGYRDRFFSTLFAFVEGLRYRHDETPESFDRLPRALVGDFNRESFDDIFAGRYDGFPFELYEAEFGQRGGATLFKGVVVAFQPAAPFDGLLIATGKQEQPAGLLGALFGSRLTSLACGVPEIDAHHDFLTDNPDAARPLVGGNIAAALGWLIEAWPEGPARVALSHADGFLLLPDSRNFFELPPASVAINFERDAKPMLADMSALLATTALVRKAGDSLG
ncbi:MAG: hypothetical protein JNL61_02135 [Rhizobiaceae bacterium]|nr:hypothetical protein [Rhizobiaceae bacterium]